MIPEILLAQLRALLERAPEMAEYSPTSRDHLVWLAQAHALVKRYNPSETISFKTDCDYMAIGTFRENSIARIFGTLHRAVADLELEVPADAEIKFGSGDVYYFFRALNKVIASAEKSLFIIDPYLDDTVFDHYLNSRQPDVSVRLLLNEYPKKVKPAVVKYIQQFGSVLEARRSKDLHDRVVFIDSYVCWVIGQSIRHAAKSKPTYLVPLAPDIVPAKLQDYEQIWEAADAI